MLTIRNHPQDSRRPQPAETGETRAAVALQALAFILSDERRAQRFLDLTGLTPDTLRGAIGDASTHTAVIEFLSAHEPDLVAAAEALGTTPDALLAAGGPQA